MRRTILLLSVAVLVLASCGGGAEETERSPAATHAGTLLFMAAELGGPRDIFVIDTDGTGRARLTSGPGSPGAPDQGSAPAWSPDGTKIVWTAAAASGEGTVWVMNADGSQQVDLTQGSIGGPWPSWSPDGTQIALSNAPGLRFRIYVMDTDGTDARRVTSGPRSADDFFASWAPDGRIFFLRVLNRQSTGYSGDVFAVNTDGSGLVRLTHGWHLGGYGLSPDGTKLAVHDTQQHRILILPVDASGGAPVTLLDTDFGLDCIMPAWSPDGERLALAVSDWDTSYGSEVRIVNADGSGLTTVPNTGLAFQPTWRPA